MVIITDQIITGDGSTILNNKAVFIDDKGIIRKIGSPEELVTLFPEECIKSYKGATLLPGLIDMHVHLGYWWNKPDSYEYNDFMIAYLALANVQEAFASGVTTIRDVASQKFLCTTMNKAAEKGYIQQIPRIISSGVGICMTGGHGYEMKGGIKEVDGIWDIKTAIREQIKNNNEWIKILTSHRSDTQEYTQEELNAASEECHRLGKKISVHAGTQPSIQMCINAGYDTIEHGTFLRVEQAQEMAKKGIAWVPTIMAYIYLYEYLESIKGKEFVANFSDYILLKEREYFKAAAQSYCDNFGQLINTGVKVVTGTDMVFNGAPITPVAKEMQYMVDFGMEPIKAIQAATLNGAEVLGLSHEIGQVKEGFLADILIIEGDPIRDISNMSKVIEVYYAGKSVFAN